MVWQVRAVGIKGTVDALTQIRVIQPLRALSKATEINANIVKGKFDVNWGDEPGIFLTYRLHPDDEKAWQFIDQKCKEGWLWVHDVDDDPRYLGGQKRHKFRSIACAHLVTVTMPQLLEVCAEWNPNVELLPNQIGPMPPKQMVTQEVTVPKVFFGALNRSKEWGGGMPYVADALMEHSDHIEVFVINDEQFAKTMPKGMQIRNYPHQNYGDYLKMIDYMDIALIPLADNEFNRSKSDLKIIESLAHGMVPITTKFAADQTNVPNNLLEIVESDEDWSRRLNELLDEPEKLAEKKSRGYDYIARNRLWDDHGTDLELIYSRALKNWDKLEKDRQERIAKRRAEGLPA